MVEVGSYDIFTTTFLFFVSHLCFSIIFNSQSEKQHLTSHVCTLINDTWMLVTIFILFHLWEIWKHFFSLTVTLQFSSHDHSAAFRYVRFINDSEPRADDVIESRLGFGRMLTHRTATLMSSVTPFVCGAPLYLWQALHFLSPAGRVFAARWFQGFRALCPYSTPLFDMVDRKSRGGGAMQTGRRREGD